MTKLQRIEQEIESLSPEELAQFRKWFQERDAALWDQQFEEDVAAGSFDALRNEAITEHGKNRTREL